MYEKRKILHEFECFKPDIRRLFKDGKCIEEQIIKCYGRDFSKTLKQNEAKEK